MKVVLNISPNNSNRTFMDNMYQYDILSNVLSVENTAALPTTGQIGGTVSYTYNYDDLNRMTTADAIFTGRNSMDNGYEQQKYSLLMEYDNLHNIVSKEQLHQKAPGQSGGTFTDIPLTTYKLDYNYDVNNKPHAPRTIVDKPYANSTGNDVKTKIYDYDANGNLTAITQKTGESDVVEKLRTNLWDEENRLRAVDITPDAEGIRPIAIYTYDAGGERILKHSNTSVSIYLNGKRVADTIQVDATLYPSGMLVAHVIPTEEESLSLGYTKHYFAGTQRVSSKIGTTENLGDYLQDWFTQGTGGPIDVIGSSFGVLENAENGVVQAYDELGIEPPTYESDPVFIPIQSFVHGGNEVEQYFFHPDHLGSTSYITNLLGEVSQHMEYFAFGETFVEEHRSSNNSPYKFNGKELDEETGWYYYGARYYDPRISIWLSVDPLTEQTMESYIYVSNNPIIYIDPTGEFRIKYLTELSAKQKERFESIIGNFSKINFTDKFYNLMTKITGASKSKMKTDFSSGKGPEIRVVNGGAFEYNQDDNVIEIGTNFIDKLNSITDSNELENYTTKFVQLFLHEYGHLADAETNGGKMSSEWMFDRNGELKLSTGCCIKYGKQEFESSLFGHRGSDVEYLIFGEVLSAESDINGKTGNIISDGSGLPSNYSKPNGSLKYILNKYSEQIKERNKPAYNLNGQSLTETLGVK